MTGLVPDDVDTRVAIGEAERVITLAKPYDRDAAVYGLRGREEQARQMVAYAVLNGHDLAWARMYAIQVALIRDARPTIAESCAACEAVTS